MLVYGTIYDNRELPGVSTAGPGVDEVLQTVSPPLEVHSCPTHDYDSVAYSIAEYIKTGENSHLRVTQTIM
jgi:hypothetical protein